MKVTDAGKINNYEEKLKDYTEIIQVFQSKEKEDRMALTINPETKPENLLLGASRMNIAISNLLGMNYKTYLKLMEDTNLFCAKTEKLDLSEEQLKKMINKNIHGRII